MTRHENTVLVIILILLAILFGAFTYGYLNEIEQRQEQGQEAGG